MSAHINSKQRVQIDFAPEALKRLDDLKDKVEASTKADVIRNALRLYDLFVTEVDPGCVVEVKDKAGNTVLKMPVKVLIS